MIFTKDFLKSMESLSLFPENSLEAITDQMGTTPVGGDLDSDSDGKSEETNEQNNELESDGDFGGDFGGGDAGDEGGEDSSGGDFGGGDGDMSDGESGEDKPMTLKASENPFKAHNGKQILDSMFEKLQNAIKNTIDSIHANSNIEIVVISDFESLLDNVDKARETVFVQPKEASMVKYRLCVKLYNNLCNSLCNQIKNGSNGR